MEQNWTHCGTSQGLSLTCLGLTPATNAQPMLRQAIPGHGLPHTALPGMHLPSLSGRAAGGGELPASPKEPRVSNSTQLLARWPGTLGHSWEGSYVGLCSWWWDSPCGLALAQRDGLREVGSSWQPQEARELGVDAATRNTPPQPRPPAPWPV